MDFSRGYFQYVQVPFVCTESIMQFIFFFTGKCRFSWEYQQNKSVIHFWCSLSDSMKDWMDFSLKDWRIKHQLLDPNLTYVGTDPYDYMICLCFARTVEHKHPWEPINKASALLTNTKHCGRNMFFLFLHLVTEVFKKQTKEIMRHWSISLMPWWSIENKSKRRIIKDNLLDDDMGDAILYFSSQ